MRSWPPFVGLLTLVSFACAGGQSGTEGEIPACSNYTVRELELDQGTLAGTARSVFESAVALGSQTAGLRWVCDAGSGYVDTTVMLSVTGEPSSATLEENGESRCDQRMRIEGAVLRFQSADGAFDESIAGVVSSAARVYGGTTVVELMFEAQSSVDSFAGTFEFSNTRRFDDPRVTIFTSLSPVQGNLSVGPSSNPRERTLAFWAADYVPTDDERGVGGCYNPGAGFGGHGGGSYDSNGGISGLGGGSHQCQLVGGYGGAGAGPREVCNDDDCRTIACAGNGGCYFVATGACSTGNGGSGG